MKRSTRGKSSRQSSKDSQEAGGNGRLSDAELAEKLAEGEAALFDWRRGRDVDLSAFLLPTPETVRAARAIPGGKFIFDQAEDSTTPVWGADHEILWAPGETLMICARQGVGKSTVMQQLALARIGIREPSLFALPVEALPSDQQILYLAMDRPRQIRRSFRRMVEPEDRDELDDRLVIWRGPVPHLKIVNDPYSLANWIEENFPNVHDVFIDSLKDLAVGLSQDDVGAAINGARQELTARGLEVVEAHHNRKGQVGNKRADTLGDVYGSEWITAGVGSVIYLEGKPGDTRIELKHLKQPMEPVGPLWLVHDHEAGRTTVHSQEMDVIAYVKDEKDGATLEAIAQECYGSTDEAAQAKARRQLAKAVGENILRHEPGESGGVGGGGKPGRWHGA